MHKRMQYIVRVITLRVFYILFRFASPTLLLCGFRFITFPFKFFHMFTGSVQVSFS